VNAGDCPVICRRTRPGTIRWRQCPLVRRAPV